MRRRVIRTWTSDREDHYRVELPGGDVSKFTCQKREEIDITNPAIPDREQHLLFWEDTLIDSFAVKEDALLFVLRFGYSTPDYHLIPSEILADFGLVYSTGAWVDSWTLTEHREVRPVSSNVCQILRPPNRLIRFTDYKPHLQAPKTLLKSPYFDEKGILNLESSRAREHEIAANLEIPKLDFKKLERPKIRIRRIERDWQDWSQFAFGGCGRRRPDEPDLTPDEECVFTLKSGNFAENDPPA